MISAQNRLQQLSGNRSISMLLLLLCLSISACKSKKKFVDATPPPPKKEEDTKPEEGKESTKKVEVIEWTFADEAAYPPIGSKKEINSIDKNAYSIAVLVPINANAQAQDFVEKGTIQNRFIEFYLGLKMALEEYTGTKQIQAHIFDSSNISESKLESIEAIREADVIIGPYDKEKIRETAYLAKEQSAVLISPWQASKKVAQKNPQYVQLKPNLEDHYYALAEDLITNFEPQQVYLLAKEEGSDKGRFKYFQEYAKSHGSRTPFQELLIPEDTINFGEVAFDSTLFEKDIAVVIPNWKSSDENFVYTCMRRLRVEKRENNVTVYGMPILAESERINYDLHLNLNATVAQSRYFDKTNPSIKNFRNRYFNTYNALPGRDACEGYDVGSYVLKNLDTYGTDFQFFLENDQNEYLLSSFDVVRLLVDPEEDPNDKKNIEYFLNKEVQILKFRNGKFQRR